MLAVGDVEFQKKCLGKMRDISTNQGRTILFVSHNIDAVQRLCSRCLLIDKGQLVANGDTADVVGRYLSEHCDRAQPNEWIDLSRMNRSGTGHARFVAAQYSSPNAAVASHAYTDGPLEFCLSIESDECRTIGSLAVTLYSPSGNKLVNADTVSVGQSIRLQKGRNLVKLRIHKLYLNPGVYVAGFWLANPISARRSGAEYDHVQSAFEIDVVECSSARFGLRSKSDGLVTCHFDVVDTA